MNEQISSGSGEVLSHQELSQLVETVGKDRAQEAFMQYISNPENKFLTNRDISVSMGRSAVKDEYQGRVLPKSVEVINNTEVFGIMPSGMFVVLMGDAAQVYARILRKEEHAETNS